MQVFAALQEHDRIGLVNFETSASVMIPLTEKNKVLGFPETCRKINAGGGTNIESGLRLGLGQFADAGASSNVALAVVLSDGSPNGGEHNKDALCAIASMVAAQSGRSITIHSLGFTAHHRVDLMNQLPQASNGPAGSYYYLGSQIDISAAIGDCLGAGTVSRPCRGLQIAVDAISDERVIASKCQWYGPAAMEAQNETALVGLQPLETLKAYTLQAAERQVALLVMPPDTTAALIGFTWESENGPEKFQARLDYGLCTKSSNRISLLGDMPLSMNIEEIIVVAHTLRLRVAAALATLAVNPNAGEHYDALHGTVIQCLNLLQAISEEGNADIEAEAVFLEGMLQALERDLGEALTSRQHGSEQQGVLLSFAAEHFAMHSASTLTRVRTAYATREQIQMRLRFLQSSAGVDGTQAKENCKIDEEGLTQEETMCRKSMEENICYVTLSPWRECVLGLGLFVHPRTCRERRGGVPPQVDLVLDYVSAEAYNLGVRTTVHSAAQDVDSDDEAGQGAMPPEVLQSSTRRRINAWLPLHINSTNWAVARTFAPSAFSLIATQLNTVFRPEDALKVCARLLCCTVVGFVRSEEGLQRAGASERAVQMYCDVHRLFLKMAEDHPIIKQMALKHVQQFIKDPDMRTRKGTPDLGLLITYLSILDEVTWSDLFGVFVPEMIRRAFGRMKEPLRSDSCESSMDLISNFDKLEPEHGRVILFFKVFNSLVARPSAPWHEPLNDHDPHGACSALSVAAVRDMYDRRWGQLPMDRCKAVLSEINRMCKITSVAAVCRELLPFDFSQSDVCELLLWADKHGQNKRAIHEWPDLKNMSSRLTQEWQVKREAQIELKKDSAQLLERLKHAQHPASECLGQLMSMTKSFWESHSIAPETLQKERFDSVEQACAWAAQCRERAAERLAIKRAKGTGKGKSADQSDSESDVPVDSACMKVGEDLGNVPTSASECVPLQVVVCKEMSSVEEQRTFNLQVHFRSSDDVVSGAHLRSLIAAETNLDARKMRLILRQTSDCKEQLSQKLALEALDTWPNQNCEHLRLVSKNATVTKWELESPDIVVEVGKKERGGRKPGNGWHAIRSHGRTYQMSIAGAIVRETVFSKVEQYFTVVDDGSVPDWLLRLCITSTKDATVLCGGGHLVLKQEAIKCGWEVVNTSENMVKLSRGSCKLLLLAEVDAPTSKTSTMFYEDEEPDLPIPVPAGACRLGGGLAEKDGGKGCGKGKGKGDGIMAGSRDEVPVPATVDVPWEVSETGLIVVLDGHLLRETASLSQVICGVCASNGRNDSPTPLFHVATSVRRVLIETEEQLQSISAALSTEGRTNTAIELLGQPSVPSGAVLMQKEVMNSSFDLPCVSELPCVLSFKLRLPSLGLVTRIRDRFGCRIYELFNDILRSLLDESAPGS